MSSSHDELQVGHISGVYGIKGWNKIYSFTDPIEQILEYSPWTLKKGRKTLSIQVETGKRQGKGIVARFPDIDDRSQAEGFIGYDIWVRRELLPRLEDGEYYWHQLESMVVVTATGDRLGTVDHLVETGANDVLVVKPDSSSIDEQERLIPYVENEVILGVDLVTREIRVAWEVDY